MTYFSRRMSAKETEGNKDKALSNNNFHGRANSGGNIFVNLVAAPKPDPLFSDLAFPFATSTSAVQTAALSRLESQRGSFNLADAAKQHHYSTNQRMKVADPLSQFAKNQIPVEGPRHDCPTKVQITTPSKLPG